MARLNDPGSDDSIKEYVRASTRRMIIGTVVCFGIMGFAFFIAFPTCARDDKVTDIRQVGNKYYLTLKGDSGTYGMWSESKTNVGARVCVRPTFAQ